MPDLDAYVNEVLPKMRAAKTDGGLIVLGLDEATDFSALDVNSGKLASDLASACADQLEPPIRPEIEIVEVDGRSVVVAIIEELPPTQKPRFIKTRGIERGSFVRTFDGDRTLSATSNQSPLRPSSIACDQPAVRCSPQPATTRSPT